MSRVTAPHEQASAAAIRIAGLVQGDVIAEDALVWIEAGARVEGQVRAAALLLAGELAGQCRAQHVWLRASARMTGLLETAWLAMDEGAQFVGQSKPARRAAEPPLPGWPVPMPSDTPHAMAKTGLAIWPNLPWPRARWHGLAALALLLALAGSLQMLRSGSLAGQTPVLQTARIVPPRPAASVPLASPLGPVASKPVPLAARPHEAVAPAAKLEKLPSSEAGTKILPPHVPLSALAATQGKPPAKTLMAPPAPVHPLPGLVQSPDAAAALPGDLSEPELLQQLASLQAGMLNSLLLDSASAKGAGRQSLFARIRTLSSTLQLTRNLLRKYAQGEIADSVYRGLAGSTAQRGQWPQDRQRLARLLAAVDPATLHADSRQLMTRLARLPT